MNRLARIAGGCLVAAGALVAVGVRLLRFTIKGKG